MISIIVAVSENMGIGKNNELLWHIPDDLKRFKKLTIGKCVIMGKKTWESLPKRPLPGRKNIVLTDDPDELFDSALTAYSVEDALEKSVSEEEIFIIGGGSVYSQFMPLAGRLYITHIHKEADADIFFPRINPETWEVILKEESQTSDDSPLPYTFVIYDRKKCRHIKPL